MVTNLSGDPNTPGSLPYEVHQANSGQTIGFAVSGTIELNSEIQIGENSPITLMIDGTGQSVTVSGGNQTRMFEVLPGSTATINNLNLTDGYSSGDGGAVLVDSNASLNLSSDTFSYNEAASGGAVANSGTLGIYGGTSFTNNSAQDDGGAIANQGILSIRQLRGQRQFQREQCGPERRRHRQ